MIAEHFAPGYYPDVPDAKYRAVSGLSQSMAKHGLRSMAHLRHAMLTPKEPSKAMLMGSALHLAIFEPGRFDREVLEAQEWGRTKAELEAKAEWYAQAAGRIVLKADDLATVKRMAASVLASPEARGLLHLEHHNEASMFWDDRDTGVRLKGRMDRYAHRASMVVDLKSTRDGSPDGFANEIWRHGYGLQAAWYLDGVERTRGEVAGFCWIAVENVEPFVCTVYEVDDATLEHGRAVMRRLVKQYAECVKSGQWPGYATAIRQNGIPTWALARASDEVNSVADSAAMEGVEDEQPI